MLIERTLLKSSLDEWNSFFKRARAKLHQRPVTFQLPTENMALALTGVRRCGKTYQSINATLSIPEEEILYYNFEDSIFYQSPDVQNLSLLLSVAEEYSNSKIQFLILDEIQNVDGWERWLRALIDQKRYKIIVTGSSAKLLSSEIATSLTGRCIEKKLWPLSFKEKLSFYNSDTLLINEFRQYLTWGGMPEIVLTQDEEIKKDILKQYLNDIVHKDVVNRHEIRNKRALDQILVYYLTNIASMHSYTALHKAFHITAETAAEYTAALQNAYLIFEVSRYHQNLKVQSRDSKKIYCVDPGFRLAGSRTIHDDTARLLENIVFIELQRRKCEVFYFKEKNEVDFIVTKQYQAIEAIQVCYDLSDQKTRKRELAGLIEAMDSLGLHRGIIITFNQEEKINVENYKIDCIPITTWLCS